MVCVAGGGTEITVTGTNFVASPDARCRFASLVVVGTTESDQTMRCVSPPHPGATVTTVEVSNNAQDFTASGVAFTYQGTRLGSGMAQQSH